MFLQAVTAALGNGFQNMSISSHNPNDCSVTQNIAGVARCSGNNLRHGHSREKQQRCRRPRQIRLTEEEARAVVKTFGDTRFRGKPYYALPAWHLQFLIRLPIKDQRQRVACQMAWENAKRQQELSKATRPPGRPKRTFRTEDIDRLRAQGWSERSISAELGIPRRTVARNHPKTARIVEEFCATSNNRQTEELHDSEACPPHTPPCSWSDGVPPDYPPFPPKSDAGFEDKKQPQREIRLRAAISARSAVAAFRPPHRKSSTESQDFARPTDSKQGLIDRYRDFLRAWPHDKRGVDLGSQCWISYIDNGTITEDNVYEVFEGLERWKASELWSRENGRYIPALANSRGTGWLQVRAWKDWPKPKEVDSWAS
jgi:hypothetical protein